MYAEGKSGRENDDDTGIFTTPPFWPLSWEGEDGRIHQEGEGNPISIFLVVWQEGGAW